MQSSGSTDIPVSDSTWHTDCSRTSTAISNDTGFHFYYIERYSGYCILIELCIQVEGHCNVLKSTG